MLYASEKIYRSLLHFTSQIIPSGVTVVDGQEYGIRVDDPTGKNPSVAVTMGDTSNAALELGSFGTEYPVTFVINAQSRLQRNALKNIVRSGIYNNSIPIYSDFNQSIPTSEAIIEQFAELGDYFQARDMPNFESERERFFWNSVITVVIDVFGL
jgi:hypothetical protein